MSDSLPDSFRAALKKFIAADATLSGGLKANEETASARGAELIKNAKAAELIANDRIHRIEMRITSPIENSHSRLSPTIDEHLDSLHRELTQIQQLQREHNRIRNEILSRGRDLQNALADEKRAREKEHETLALRRKFRRNAIIVGATSLVCAAAIAHFWLLRKTTLSFQISTDGSPIAAWEANSITVDGRSFTSGDKITVKSHVISINVPDAEPVQRTFWTFYGSNDLGTIDLKRFKGALDLASDPPDAEYDLKDPRDGSHLRGNLPARLENIPLGNYVLNVTRKGWNIQNRVAVSRGTTTNKTEFPYGSIQITSEPLGIKTSVDGNEVGRTPLNLHEIKPGEHDISIDDGSDILQARVLVNQSQSVTQRFTYHYGSVQLSTIPPGATVTYKGKEIGQTPLLLSRIPAMSRSEARLRLDGFITTNVNITANENTKSNYTIVLVSEQYIQALADARSAAAVTPPDYSRALSRLGDALRLSPNDLEAIQLRNDYTYRFHFKNASEMLAAQQFSKALAEVNSALETKPGDIDADTLKSRILVEKIKQDDQRIVTSFDGAIAVVMSDSEVVATPTKTWRVHATISDFKEALHRALGHSKQWTIKTEAQPTSDATIFYLKPPGILFVNKSLEDNQLNFVIQAYRLSEKDIDVRAKMLSGLLPDTDPARYKSSRQDTLNALFAFCEVGYLAQEMENFSPTSHQTEPPQSQ